MKQFFKVLGIIAGLLLFGYSKVFAMSAAGALGQLRQESQKTVLDDSQLAEKLVKIVTNQAFLRPVLKKFLSLCKGQLTSTEVGRIEEILELLQQLRQTARTELFQKEVELFVQAEQEVATRELSDQELHEKMNQLRQSCPFFLSWMQEFRKLQEFQDILMAAFVSVDADSLLADALKGLKE